MIYLDHAATTPLHPEVAKLVFEEMKENYANPSSTHTLGRQAKAAVEQARKSIATVYNVSAQDVVFTSGGSEANNLILWNAVTQLGVKNIISSRIEHHSVIKSLEHLANTYGTQIRFVKIGKNGLIDYEYLEKTLSRLEGKTLVSLMYVNNEIGTVLDIDLVGKLTKEHGALFHSDTVQGIGCFPIDLQQTPIDFISASAHKFHGPKGVGFGIMKKDFNLQPMLHGGGQEHGKRAGTENVHSIIGMAKALELSRETLDNTNENLYSIKKYFVRCLLERIPDIQFNAQSDQLNAAPHILNIRLPKSYPMLLFKLDMAGIACSGGSACQSGSNQGSHVLKEVLSIKEAKQTSLRFSFSQWTTQDEIDQAVEALCGLI